MSSVSFHQDFFRLPKGSKLVRCLFTTMSMDLETMLRMGVMCLWPERENADKQLLKLLAPNPRNPQIRFFYDGNDPSNCRLRPETDVPHGLQRAVVPVRGKFTCFHPKLILLEYQPKDSKGEKCPSLFRLLVSSKNLTNAEAFETGVWLESVSRETACETAHKAEWLNHNLPELICFLKKHTEHQDDFLGGLHAQLQSVNFVLKGDTDPDRVQITVSGVPDLTDQNCRPRQQNTLVDLLLGGDGKNHFGKNEKNENMIILSPDYETSKKAVKNLFIVKPVEPGNPQNPILTHGKLYYKKDGPKTLWIGSANCTVEGLTKNVECVAMIKGAEGVWEEAEESQKKQGAAGKLFGQPCVRYKQEDMQERQSNPLLEALNHFLKNHTIKLLENPTKDQLNQFLKGRKVGPKDKRRKVYVFISPNPPAGPSAGPSAGQDITIKLLPLGMTEKTAAGSSTANDNSKWKSLEEFTLASAASAKQKKDAQLPAGNRTWWKTDFTGRRNEKATYALRLRADGKYGNCTQIVYWQDVPDNVLNEWEKEAFENFIGHPWLEDYVEASGSAEKVRALYKDIVTQAQSFAPKSPAEQERLEQILAAARHYCEHFCPEKEEL